jgi:hypothetical protein
VALLADALKVQDGAEGLGFAAASRESDQLDLAVPGEGDGAVGGAEVDADCAWAWSLSRLPHLPIISQVGVLGVDRCDCFA